MNTLFGRTISFLAVIAMAVPTPTFAAETATTATKVHDIRLTSSNEFSGLILTEKGKPVAGVPVQLISDSKVIASVKTDRTGRYRVEGVRPGMHIVKTVKGQETCRLWAAQTAPPSARPALMMTAYTTVVRGQNCGDDGCGEVCEWNGCGEDCDGCGEGCGGRSCGIGSIVASPAGLLTVAAFSAVSVVTVTSATNSNATLGGSSTPPPASP